MKWTQETGYSCCNSHANKADISNPAPLSHDDPHPHLSQYKQLGLENPLRTSPRAPWQRITATACTICSKNLHTLVTRWVAQEPGNPELAHGSLLLIDVHRGATVSVASPASTISNRQIPRLESL
jgi:hypothetical protein